MLHLLLLNRSSHPTVSMVSQGSIWHNLTYIHTRSYETQKDSSGGRVACAIPFEVNSVQTLARAHSASHCVCMFFDQVHSDTLIGVRVIYRFQPVHGKAASHSTQAQAVTTYRFNMYVSEPPLHGHPQNTTAPQESLQIV